MSSPQMGGDFLKMRANRTVIASNCLTCGQGFSFGEEVVLCSTCGGYHHAFCWQAAPICQHNIAGAAPAPQEPAPPPAPVQPVQPVPSGSPRTPAADEQRCPQCREIIKQEALKCRFCGYILNAQLAAQEIWPAKAGEIDKAATTSLVCGIIGLFICGPILGTVAIVQANKAIREIDMAPQYGPGSKGKATAGRVLGIIGLVGWLIVIVVRISNMN